MFFSPLCITCPIISFLWRDKNSNIFARLNLKHSLVFLDASSHSSLSFLFVFIPQRHSLLHHNYTFQYTLPSCGNDDIHTGRIGCSAGMCQEGVVVISHRRRCVVAQSIFRKSTAAFSHLKERKCFLLSHR